MTTALLVAATMAFPMCRQTVTVDCKDAEAARDLTAEIVQLGEGEKFVFSARWDDRNPRALPLCRALAPTGLKSTFYVSGRHNNDDYTAILREEVATGCSIACHTISHAYMGRLLPAKSFREILQNRIELEVDSQSPVVALGMPYGQGAAGSAAAGFDNVKVVGEAARNAGILGGAEHERSAANFGFTTDEWISSYVYRANDQKPDAKVFKEGFSKGMKLLEQGKLVNGPQITLGVHPWQSDAGMVDLAGMVREVAAMPGVVMMNENQYIASRMQFRHSTIHKEKTDGKKVVFEIMRPSPVAIGAAMPMNLKLSDGRFIKVAPPEDAPMPAKYTLLNGALAVSDDDSAFTLTFTNTTDKEMRDVLFALRLPPGYVPGVVEKKVASIAPGKVVKLDFKPRLPENPLFREGTLYVAVEINYVGNRIWAPLEKKRGDGKPLPCPRDTAICFAPVPTTNAPSVEAVKAMSVPGAELLPGEWSACSADPEGDASWAVNGYKKGTRGRVNKMVGWYPVEGKGHLYLLAFDFEADVAAHGEVWKYVFEGGHVQKKNATLFLNGEALDKPFGGEIKLRAGRNRLVVRLVDVDPNMFETVLAIRSAKDGSSAKFIPIAIR